MVEEIHTRRGKETGNGNKTEKDTKETRKEKKVLQGTSKKASQEIRGEKWKW